MARPRAFDPDMFLDRSLDLFWRRGFAATSMTDIYEATGLGAGSVYAFVKDKTELFQLVFKRYGGLFADTLPTDREGMPAVDHWVRFLVGYLADDPDRRGCLICNTIIERSAHAPETLSMVEERVAEVRRWLIKQLRLALEEGETRGDLDPCAAADSLIATTLGMMTLARADADRTTLASIAEAALRTLRT